MHAQLLAAEVGIYAPPVPERPTRPDPIPNASPIAHRRPRLHPEMAPTRVPWATDELPPREAVRLIRNARAELEARRLTRAMEAIAQAQNSIALGGQVALELYREAYRAMLEPPGSWRLPQRAGVLEVEWVFLLEPSACQTHLQEALRSAPAAIATTLDPRNIVSAFESAVPGQQLIYVAQLAGSVMRAAHEGAHESDEEDFLSAPYHPTAHGDVTAGSPPAEPKTPSPSVIYQLLPYMDIPEAPSPSVILSPAAMSTIHEEARPPGEEVSFTARVARMAFECSILGIMSIYGNN